MDRQEALDLLNDKSRSRGQLSPERAKALRLARTRAQGDAQTALVRLHREDYKVLYQAAVERRMAELEND